MVLRWPFAETRIRYKLVKNREPLPGEAFVMRAGIAGEHRDLAIAMRASIAMLCRVQEELLFPEDELSTLHLIMRCGLQFGWDAALFLIDLENRLGVSIKLSAEDLPEFVRCRSGQTCATLGEWISTSVAKVAVGKTEHGSNPPAAGMNRDAAS